MVNFVISFSGASTSSTNDFQVFLQDYIKTQKTTLRYRVEQDTTNKNQISAQDKKDKNEPKRNLTKTRLSLEHFRTFHHNTLPQSFQ